VLLNHLFYYKHLPTPGEPESRAALKKAPLSSFAHGPTKTDFVVINYK